jgi:hypothetical protein
MADVERLIGSDGKLVTVELGTELNGDGQKTLDELAGGTAGDGIGKGWYRVSALAASSALPSGLSVGDLFWDDGTLVPVSGDSVQPLSETEKSDITNFSIEINRAEVDVTTISDNVKRYRAGKTDMTGSLEGITDLGITTAAGYIINNFIRVIEQAADGAVTVNSIDDSPIYLKGVIQKSTASGEKEAFIWAKVSILSTSLGAGGEDSQSFSGNFRIAPGDPEPTFYLREVV